MQYRGEGAKISPEGEIFAPSAALAFSAGKRRCSAAETESAFAEGKNVGGAPPF